jgi:type I restriction-modification system DNA methylase subunit
MGYILPHKFFNAQYGKNLRQLITQGKHLSEVVHFGDQQVFQGATTYTALLFLTKAPQKSFHFSKIEDLPTWVQTFKATGSNINADGLTSTEWNFSSNHEAALIES